MLKRLPFRSFLRSGNRRAQDRLGRRQCLLRLGSGLRQVLCLFRAVRRGRLGSAGRPARSASSLRAGKSSLAILSAQPLGLKKHEFCGETPRTMVRRRPPLDCTRWLAGSARACVLFGRQEHSRHSHSCDGLFSQLPRNTDENQCRFLRLTGRQSFLYSPSSRQAKAEAPWRTIQRWRRYPHVFIQPAGPVWGRSIAIWARWGTEVEWRRLVPARCCSSVGRVRPW